MNTNTNTKKSGAAVVASEKITEAVARFAKYRDAYYKANDAAREATRKHCQQWSETGHGNKARYNAMIEASRVKESAGLACSFAREIVREMLAAEAVKAYADTIGGFVGKSAGPKTCEKVYKEIADRLEGRGFRGVRVWFGSLIYGRKFSKIEISAEGLNGSENVTLYGKYGDNGCGNELTDTENRFNGRELCGHEFPTDDRTPEQFAADFIAAEEELEQLRKDYEKDRDKIAQRVRVGAVRPRSWHTVEDQRNA